MDDHYEEKLKKIEEFDNINILNSKKTIINDLSNDDNSSILFNTNFDIDKLLKDDDQYYNKVLNKELSILEEKEEKEYNTINKGQMEEYKYRKPISSKLFIDCMTMSDRNFNYINDRINILEEKNDVNEKKIVQLNQIINKFFLIYKEHNKDIKTMKLNLNSLFSELLVLYTKYDKDISDSFKTMNSNTKLLLEEIFYNSSINNLLINNKIDDVKKENHQHKSRKRKLEKGIKIMDEKIDNSDLFPRKSARLIERKETDTT